MASLANRSIAEGVGTALLVYFGAGAAAITLMIAHGTKPATPFNIGIGQLGGLGDWFAIGITFGIVIAAVIYALGRVSGAHINPARTFGPYVMDFLLGSSNLWVFFPIYILGPVIGAIAAAVFYDRITAE
ncbi:MAG: aquaporin [Methanomicrobiales archaeon]|nr:aquaporin [Methanomicrobiales archaeon]